jgi:CPA1 family monovalent cation:H+ antiporter
MLVFETILILLLGATVLSALARRMRVPYPTLLALGGAAVALVPGGPRLVLPPELILALFVAPVLLDAAFDASLRDLRKNWAPVLSLVLGAVALTTAAVAFAAKLLIPDMPWPAAVALGALCAPPDAVAALAVLRQIEPPHRVRTILEGESLLNDASALLIYRLAVGAAATGGFSVATAAPTFALVALGSVVVGWLLAAPSAWLISKIEDAPSSVIVQFTSTFGLWLLAERLHLSGVVTIVVYAVTLAHRDGLSMPARIRVPSFAIWETATVVLNVLAFTLIGLQIRPILEALTPDDRTRYFLAALAILAVVIPVRMAWAAVHFGLAAAWAALLGRARPSARGSAAVSWSGMRGIVTLAAAMALPGGFPYRDFIQFAAFVVVLGTLVIQGATLRPLLLLLKFPSDGLVEKEVHLARKAAMKAAKAELKDETSDAAARLRAEYAEALEQAMHGGEARATEANDLRRRAAEAGRTAILELRREGAIGDDAYARVQEELDWLELSAAGREAG